MNNWQGSLYVCNIYELSFCLSIDESGKLDQAAAILPDEEPTLGAIAAAEGALANGDDIDIDEDLFGAECDIELDEIDLDD